MPSSFFPGILLENLQKPRQNSWFLKRTMVEKNGKGINPINGRELHDPSNDRAGARGSLGLKSSFDQLGEE